MFQDASKDASAIDSAVQGAGADASRVGGETTDAGTNAVPGQTGGFNLQSEVSEYATEANMQKAADGVFGKQTVRQFAPWPIKCLNVLACCRFYVLPSWGRNLIS